MKNVDTSVKMDSSTDFSIRYSRSYNNPGKEFHFHDSNEIALMLSGGGIYYVNQTAYEIERGDILFFNGMDLHKYVFPPELPYERVIVSFHHAYIDGVLNTKENLLELFTQRTPGFCHRLHLTEKQLEAVLYRMNKAIHYEKSDVFGRESYRKLSLIEILLTANEFYHANHAAKISRHASTGTVGKILEYIVAHYFEELTLDTLAKTFFLNKCYMSRIFREATGSTINDYIINCRIMKARELLRENKSVTQVCEMVGYNNISHFIRSFKQKVGVSPKQYAGRMNR